MILTHPLAFLPLQLAEEKLQLFYCDAVAGEHAQHVYQEVWKKCTPKSIGLTQWLHKVHKTEGLKYCNIL